MAVCKFVLVRHGETMANRTGLLQGQTECPLNENGRAQAAASAERLSKMHFDAAYASTLSRAWETAQIIVSRHPGLELQEAPALREWHLGDLENRMQPELLKLYPEEMASFRRECMDIRIPNGESLADVQRRVSSFLEKLADASAGKTILLVTHGGILQRVFRMAVGVTAPENYVSLTMNTSVSIVLRHVEDKAWQLVSWNSTDHLQNLPTHETLSY